MHDFSNAIRPFGFLKGRKACVREALSSPGIANTSGFAAASVHNRFADASVCNDLTTPFYTRRVANKAADDPFPSTSLRPLANRKSVSSIMDNEKPPAYTCWQSLNLYKLLTTLQRLSVV